MGVKGVFTSFLRVSAVLSQYFNGTVGLYSNASAFFVISCTLMGATMDGGGEAMVRMEYKGRTRLQVAKQCPAPLRCRLTEETCSEARHE